MGGALDGPRGRIRVKITGLLFECDGLRSIATLSRDDGTKGQDHRVGILFQFIKLVQYGCGFIEAVRKDGRFRAIPILVLTTESDVEKKQRARKAGATGWIVKPFDPFKLVEAIRRVAA